MGITGLVGAYETFYGGVPNRIHNVQLVAHLIDNHFVAPGAEFSFNGTTGERTPDKGFLEAPVIINGELKTGLGGGICQVSTTTFNAAYEAGLPITDRTNHALYISHYPLGRDATVNYSDTDLKFVNDTDHWLWLRTFVGSSSLTVALYGTPQNRRVESDVSPLVTTGQPPVKKVSDPNLLVGQTSVEEYGSPSRATSVRRRVYSAGGKLLYDHTWYSSYRAEPRVIRVGTKPVPEPPVKKKKPAPPPPTTADSFAADFASTALSLGLRSGDRLREPGRHARGPVVADRHAGVRRPALGDRLPVALDRVVEAEASTADVATASPDRELVVEARRRHVLRVRLQGQSVDAFLPQGQVATAKTAQILDPRRLEPDEIGRVMGDSLGIRLGKANGDVICKTPRHARASIAAARA